jgi:hypothetical protein
MPSDEGLNAMSREWCSRIAVMADGLEAAAQEWKVPDSDEYMMPHAEFVMQMALNLRTIVANAEQDFPDA